MAIHTSRPVLLVLVASAISSVVCLIFGLASDAAATQAQPTTTSAELQIKEPKTSGSPPTARLINSDQYANAIADVFGPDISGTARFPPTRRIDGLVALGASTAAVTPGLLEMFDSRARDIAARVVDEQHRGVLIPCKPADPRKPDDACARKFLGSVGKLLFRRPLTLEEIDIYAGAAQHASESVHDFYAGLGSALSGMLIAPQFLYFIEHSEPDPDKPGSQRLDGYSRAMRLSLLFWNAPPDGELLRAAEAGELYTQKGVNRQVERMMASPRLKDGVRAFFDDWMIMEDFALLAKDPVLYPAFNLKVAMEAKEQTLRMVVNELITKNGDYRDLFTTRSTFLTRNLGAIYRVPVSVAGPSDWVSYELPEHGPRAGLLTQAGFLAVHAHAGRSSPTRRGKALREIFMCQKVPVPPPNVSFDIFEDPNGNYPTARDRAQAHSTDKACASCHKVTDPIGLALENFDGAAQYRERENGVVIDASGNLDGVAYDDATGLAKAVHDNANVALCVVKQIYSYGIGREVTKDDRDLLKYFVQRFSSADYKFTALLRTVATSNAFYEVAQSDDGKAKVASAANMD